MRVMNRCRIAGLWMICAVGAASARAPLYSSQIELGRALFEDKNLSLNRSVACASCHVEAHAFTDARPVSVGIQGHRGTRNAPTLVGLASYTSYFWDGRVKTLEEQLLFPLTSATEMGLSAPGAVLARVRENVDYLRAFKKLDGVEPEQLRMADVAGAITAYERSLAAAQNPIDLYLSGNESAVSPEVREGLALFSGKAGCASCHRISTRGAALTDNDYHSSGVGLVAVTPKLAALTQRLTRMPVSARFQASQSEADVAALGRFLVTLDPKDIGKFRTPSLRNVSRTAPYMHDGSVETLEKAVDIELYYRGLDLGYPIIVSTVEKRALLSFLGALSTPDSLSVGRIQ
jgi:cytochrome c peroxidase